VNHPADLARLAEWDVNGRLSEAHFAKLFDNPDFPGAARALSQGMLAAADADTAFDGMVKDGGRFLAANWALYLHLTGGLTLPRLKALCAASGIISPGRARAILLYLRYLGYVTLGPQKTAGPAHYVVTSRLVTAFGTLTREGLRAVRIAEPSVRLILDCLDRPETLSTMMRIQAEGFRHVANEMDTDTAFHRVFMHRHAGMQILHAILLTASEHEFPPRDAVAISITALASRFHVSRTHVRRLIESAEADGFLKRVGEGAVAFTEEGRQSVRYLFALRLIGYLVCAAKTSKEIFAETETWSMREARAVGA
jgi:hypothetical protein